MKRLHLLYGIAALLSFAACTESKQTTTETTTAVPAAEAKLDSLFYKHLEGSIAGKAIVMELIRSTDYATGSYYYRDIGIPIKLQFDSIAPNGELRFSEMMWSTSGNPKAPQFIVKWNGKAFTGTWKDEDKGKNFPIVLTETYAKSSVPFRVMKVIDSVYAFPGKKNSPQAKATIQTLIAEANPNSRFVNTQIKSIMQLQGSDWNKALKASAQRFFNDYDTGISEEDLNDPELARASMNYESLETLGVRYNEKDFLVFEAMNFAYTGGAHGNHGITFTCFDLKTKRRLKLKDIVNIDSAGLQRQIEKRFRQQYGLAPGASLKEILFDDFLAANENVYFNDKGIGFLYNPYEIAAYAAGELEVFVPYTDVRGFIVPAFKQRMGL
ncbi:DUF3298 and DUF4163 domain-containing protein [Pedobacter sp. SYP-B3415]|uniref:DUF3298 and DUF4163 domain-containing protein n=1 Tax=Pedobacter sp. SYP-B3415 TaxID=2496641 RepID=UPI00101BB2A7|nr:DUF3298 and DUF4163 domain-containing protein [Pedobacter sp. SYP-B3415]